MTDKETRPMIELTASEQKGLEQVASGEPPYSQRAKALLALAEGADLAGAGASSGLTVNQVRYWLGRFGTNRLSIFPEELLLDPTPEQEGEKDPPLLDAPKKSPLLKAPELAGELPETIPDGPELAAAGVVAAAGATAAIKTKKGKNKKKKKPNKDKKAAKGKKAKKSKKDKDGKKSKKDKKSKKGKKNKKTNKKNKKDKKSKKAKKDKKKK